MFKFISVCLLFLPLSALAAWKSDGTDSSINFLSTKLEHVVETHQFDRFQAEIATDGTATVEIDLSSVNTLIPIRDERMREFLFKTSQFSSATLSSKLDLTAINKMKVGQSIRKSAKASLDLHGKKVDLNIELLIVALESGLLIQSVKPVVLDSRQFGLTAGVDKLRELAGLPSISYAVPVSFSLNMRKQ
ncbi:YceI family protein [Aliikangiella marina]|uniref:YceI family protein n=1 Tax=Aliikangiella marina TaxID=1712262 RepID=A0A545T114_9GAMM|nr:YceI family protein [Aliikangiella marina]TQV70904.1 YceI family protein [Aliikangiella marina]